jgi:hypothetical protein
MFRWFELVLGFIVWTRVLWDGFATVVLPRTVSPMSRLSGRFNKLSWRLWAVVGRQIPNPKLRLSYLRSDFDRVASTSLDWIADFFVRADVRRLGSSIPVEQSC